MSDMAIRVEGLGKRYRIGERKPYRTLRDTLVEWCSRPRLWLGRAAGRRASSSGSGAVWALRDVSFQVRPGEAVAIIGRNGSGKSTLLKILARVTYPTAGWAELVGRVGSLLEVGTGFHPELTGRENVYLAGAILGMRRREIARRFDEIVSFAEVGPFLDTPVKHYSSGMHMRLAFAVAAHLEPEVLLIDEVLAVGDIEFQRKCLAKMREITRQGRTVLFVSHSMRSVQNFCRRAILLENGTIKEDGNVADVVQRYLRGAGNGQVEFSKGPIRNFRVSQVGDEIELVAQFATAAPLRVTNLGFVIEDADGHPLFGTSPLLCGLEDFGRGRRCGTIRARVRQPRLLDGLYRVSLWFGDGRERILDEPACVSFEVVRTTGVQKKLPGRLGRLAPECQWVIEDDSRKCQAGAA